MQSSPSLKCNFTIKSTLDVGVSFQNDDGGANYGGQITISTPGTVTTGLWNSPGWPIDVSDDEDFLNTSYAVRRYLARGCGNPGQAQTAIGVAAGGRFEGFVKPISQALRASDIGGA